MSLFVTALNSGSNGNCFYIGTEHGAILVDAGISCRETERRLDRLGLSLNKVSALFISHEHIDHVRGMRVLAKKYQIPVYSTSGTIKANHLPAHYSKNYTLLPYQPIHIGELEVISFPKNHDAHDPQSFIIRHKDTCVGIFTDIGIPCEHVIKNFKCCHAIFLETNYDTDMLLTGPYPYHLKRRISSHYGHLSNQQALELFRQHKSQNLTHLFLSHLSKENNDPQLVYKLFQSFADGVEIVLTSRTGEIPIYQISSLKKKSPRFKSVQLSLFST